MAERTLYDKIWQSHTVGILPTGQTQLFIGLHLIHEITTAPAFDMLRENGLDVAFRDRTFATVDHIVPTDLRQRPFKDQEAEELTQSPICILLFIHHGIRNYTNTKSILLFTIILSWFRGKENGL